MKTDLPCARMNNNTRPRGTIVMPAPSKEEPSKDLAHLAPHAPGHEFFEHAESHPFRHDSDKFQLVNAWWLAEASHLAYLDARAAVQTWQRTGFECRVLNRGSTQCHVAHDGDVAIVAFRGTQIDRLDEFVKDMVRNLSFLPQPWDRGQVHGGFKTALEEIWRGDDGLAAHLESLRRSQSDLSFWFTGHSLGAAIATLAADRFGDIRGLYTFGSPRVGDEGFVAQYGVNAYRFVNHNDLIPQLPPVTGLSLPFVDDFQHVGDFKYITEDAHIIDNPHLRSSIAEQLRRGFSDFMSYLEQLKDRNVTAIPLSAFWDHAPVLYSVRIWNDYVADLRRGG